MKPIYEMGQHSILLLAVHYIDGIWYPLIEDKINIYIALIIRLLIDVSFSFIILNIKERFNAEKKI